MNEEKENRLGIKLPDYISEKNAQRFFEFIQRTEKETYPEIPVDFHTDITSKSIPEFLERFKNKNIKILDVGCGQGPALKLFQENGVDAIGITLNDEDVEVCKSKGYNVYKMDQSFLDFKDSEFDGIWARHVLEHSFMPYYTLNEYGRVLKTEGILYIEVPSQGTPFIHESNPNHYSVLTENMWLHLLLKAGFEILETKIWKLDYEKGTDLYNVIIAKKKNKDVVDKKRDKLYLALSKGENFGWGVCSKYLNLEVPKIYQNAESWDFTKEKDEQINVKGKVFHALTGPEFESISKLRGTENYGYTFFENELMEASIENSKKYDLVIGGSNWNKEKLIQKGIKNTGVLIQGIDPQLFYPIEDEKDDELFVIFSGGKFELRKGQDLVLKAIKILQHKYPNIVLINAWFNMWPRTMELMGRSIHINFDIRGNTFTEQMNHLYHLNGIDSSKILTNEIVSSVNLRDIYKNTDIGLFPNRCEGGTNLVLMEYMACGKPVIASYNTGHKDILTEYNSLMLKEMSEYKIFNSKRELWADWYEPSIDEIIAKLEWAYFHRSDLKKIGNNAGEFMKKHIWHESAVSLLKIIGLA
jgi:glycosyltransferase involved in cell wall biosynthesis/SAM-dependent methyltransferase